ncbi:MAG: hypothetical protein ACHQHO_05000 [Solirubrobacterales bacterium]
MKSRLLLAALMATLAVAGCGSSTGPQTIPAREAAENKAIEAKVKAQTKREEAAERKKAAAETKHRKAEARRKAAKRAALKRELHTYEQSPEYKKIQAEMRQGREYEQAHKGEEEAHEQEYERRVRGELTPSERKDQEVREHEASVEAEAIREGERLKGE